MSVLGKIILYSTLLTSFGLAKKRVGFWGNFLGHHSPREIIQIDFFSVSLNSRFLPASYRSCSGNVFHDNTILFNPNYPQPYGGGSRCGYQIHRASHKICQLRIDFLAFSLAQPNGDGECTTDYFTVENAASNIPRICGENTGSHVYVDVRGSFPISIIVATSESRTFNRRWQLQVTQIKCLSHLRGKCFGLILKFSFIVGLSAPANCLQYYPEPTGFIMSFNYNRDENGNLNSIGVSGTRQLANTDYNICIKRSKCSITYTRVGNDLLCLQENLLI